MNYNKLLIPESIVFYIFAFLACTAVLATGLGVYYHLPALEGRFGEGSFAIFNLERQANLVAWFFSVLWFVMVIESIVIIGLTYENRIGLAYQLFWGNVALICLAMSADSICSFMPQLAGSVGNCLVKAGISQGAQTIVYKVLYLAISIFLFLQLSCLFRYIRRQCQSRIMLRSCFVFCVMVFGMTLFCCWKIPNEAESPESVYPSTPAGPAIRHKDQRAPRSRGLIASDTERSRTITLKTDDVKTRLVDQSDDRASFRYASRENDIKDGRNVRPVSQETDLSQETDSSDMSGDSENNEDETAETNEPGENAADEAETMPLVGVAGSAVAGNAATGNGGSVNATAGSGDANDDRPKMEHWEDIFGWNKTVEEQFSMTQTIEQRLHCSKSIEEMLLGSNVSLDLYRVRNIVRFGMFGFSLIMLCIGFGLVARGGRLRINQHYRDQFSTYYQVNEGMRLAMKKFY